MKRIKSILLIAALAVVNVALAQDKVYWGVTDMNTAELRALTEIPGDAQAVTETTTLNFSKTCMFYVYVPYELALQVILKCTDTLEGSARCSVYRYDNSGVRCVLSNVDGYCLLRSAVEPGFKAEIIFGQITDPEYVKHVSVGSEGMETLWLYYDAAIPTGAETWIAEGVSGSSKAGIYIRNGKKIVVK